MARFGWTGLWDLKVQNLTVTESITIPTAFTFGDITADSLTFATSDKVIFRAATQYVNSSGANVLDVVGPTVTITASTKINLDGATDISGAVTIDAGAKGINFANSGGAVSASGIFMGAGTSVSPATTAAADKMFVEFRTQSTATSGDSRCLYMRHDLAGIGVSGESLRSFTKISAAVATARGAHISIDLADAGSVSGFGAGVDAQVMLANATYSSTLTALNLEVYGSVAGSDIGVGTTSFMRLSLGGNGTAVGNIDDNVSFINFVGLTAGSGKLIDTDKTALSGKAGLRVYLNGALYGYIPIVTGV